MRVVVRPHVDRKFFELIEIKMRLAEDLGRRFSQKSNGPLDQLVIRTMRRAGIPEIDRDRTEPLVRIRLHLSPVLEHGQGAIADEIIEPLEGSRNDPLPLGPGGSLFQHGLDHPHEKERLPEIGRA